MLRAKLKKVTTRLKMYRLYKTVNGKKVIFIISTGRTGTNFMESFLNSASDDVFCVHEPQPDLFNISIEKMREKKKSELIKAKIKSARLGILNYFLQQGRSIFVESNQIGRAHV